MSRITFIGAAALTSALLLAGCGGDRSPGTTESPSPSPVVSLNETPMSEQDAAALDEMVASLYPPDVQSMFPGLWLGVWDPTKGAFVKAYGQAEVDQRPASTDDVFRIGSVTKTVTATVVLELVGQGRLALADTVATVAPAVAEAHPEVADLTIEDLLGMASGLADYMNVPDGVVAGITEDPSRVWAADELISAGLEAGVKPAGTLGYSTTNYIVLQEVVEEVTGKPLQALIADSVAGPLGTTQFLLPANEDTALPDPSSHGYLNKMCVAEVKADGGKAEVGTDTSDWSASYGQGGGGMQATITDLGRWGASGLGNALLPDDLAAQRLKTQALPEDLAYGLGIVDFGDGFVGHSGEALGWQAQVVNNPETGVTIAMATNACSQADPTIFDGIRFLVPFTLESMPASGGTSTATP